MAYGLNVKNDSSEIQIDATYINYALWEHDESVSTVDQGSYHSVIISFSSNSSQPPLIALKPDTDDYCGVHNYIKSGTDYSGFEVISEDKVVTFSWQAFVPRTDKSSETYGLRVYNSSTTLVFDGGHHSMIITDVDTTSPAYNAVNNVTHPSDSDAYFIMTPQGFWQTVTDLGGGYSLIQNYIAMFKYIDATTVSFGGREFSQGTIPASITFSDGYWPDPWTIITVGKAF